MMVALDVAPHRGMRFVHSRQLVEDRGLPVSEWPHETCEVTAVRRGTVYYRNSTGFLTSTSIERFPDSVAEVVCEHAHVAEEAGYPERSGRCAVHAVCEDCGADLGRT